MFIVCRYYELVSKVGELEPFRDISLGPGPTNCTSTVLLNVYFDNDDQESGSAAPWSYRFGLDATTSDVKRLLSRKFIHLPPTAFTLHFNPNPKRNLNANPNPSFNPSFGPDHMKYPRQTLRKYGAKDRDEIHIRLTLSNHTPSNRV